MSKSKPSLLNDATCWRDASAKSIGYFSKLEAIQVDEALLTELETMALETGENVRLSLHAGPDDDFHEMIICQHKDQIHPPKKHDQKDKSFHIMKGEMAVYTFNEDGSISDAVILDGSTAHLYRVRRGVYHADFPVTETVIHHESTTGPFLGDQDSVFAPWIDISADGTSLLTYRDQLYAQLETGGK